MRFRDRGWIALVAIAIGLFLLPVARGIFDFSVFYLVFLSGILFWAAQATSWNILSGYSGYFSFGQGAFFGAGAYTMAVLVGRQGRSWLLAIVVGGVVAMLLALAIGTIAFRLRSLRGEIFALLTLAVPFILLAIARRTPAIDGGQGVILAVPEYPSFMGQFQEFIFLLSAAVAVIALAVAYIMQRTRWGWALFALRDAEDVAEGLGVPTFRHKMVAIGANGLIAGFSGAVWALQVGFVSVEGTFNLRVPLFSIVIAVLGGRNFWAGPLVGAIYIETMRNRLADGGLEGWSLIILGTILVTLVLLAPEGLMGRFARRPWTVVGVFAAVLAFLGFFGDGILAFLQDLSPPAIIDTLSQLVLGGPVGWLAGALAAAAIVAFLPGGKERSRPTGDTASRLGEAALTDGEVTEPAASSVGRPLVVATDVTKSFGGVHALRGVSATVSEGELVGLVGPNGSGKTTLVNLLSGVFPPTSGSITLDGIELVGLQPHKIAHLGIARTYQIPKPFTSLTVRDNVAIAIMFGRDPHGLDAARRAAEEYLTLVGLSDLGDAYPGEINLHERQLLEMARAMATKPAVLLLDEALAGLNPVEIDNAVAVVRRIQASGVSIVLVEHLLRVVNQLATRIIVLDQGTELASGEPAVVMSDPAVITAYLGRQAHAAGD